MEDSTYTPGGPDSNVNTLRDLGRDHWHLFRTKCARANVPGGGILTPCCALEGDLHCYYCSLSLGDYREEVSHVRQEEAKEEA